MLFDPSGELGRGPSRAAEEEGEGIEFGCLVRSGVSNFC
jgi:hypothetical protein